MERTGRLHCETQVKSLCPPVSRTHAVRAYMPAGLGVWQRKQFILDAKTLDWHPGHCQSPGRVSPCPPPPLNAGAWPALAGRGVWQRKHALRDAKQFAWHEGHAQSPSRTSLCCF